MTETRSRHRFYVPVEVKPGEVISLPGETSRQIRRVLRLSIGDEVTLFNGTGFETVARIIDVSRSHVDVKPVGKTVAGTVPGQPDVHLGLGLLKADRFDLVVQKATELGVRSVTPIECERSVVSLSADRAQSRRARWERISIEALEQSGRADFVKVRDPIRLSDAPEQFRSSRKLVAWEQANGRSLVTSLAQDDSAVDILVGPEGGFSETEVAQLGAHGFEPVSLGSLILRSETAAICALAMIRAVAEIGRADSLAGPGGR